MFGIYRTILALLVVATHLGPVPNVGPYAVFAFYVLSGYLMTAILHRTYGYGLHGVLRYGANRLLRIVPSYWIAVLLGATGIFLVGNGAARNYHEAMGLDVTGADLARNLALLLTVDTPTRWVPPAWALTVELFYYALMGLGLSRTWWSSSVWFVASLSYTLYLIVGDAAFSYRYFTIGAASLPFSLGALVFHVRQRTNTHAIPFRVVALVLSLFFANLLTAVLGSAEVWRAQFYLNVALAGAATACLAGVAYAPLRRVDAAVGELSYPAYLLHYGAGLFLVLFGLGGSRGDWTFMLAGGALTLVLAWVASATLEPAVQAIRNRVRAASPLEAR